MRIPRDLIPPGYRPVQHELVIELPPEGLDLRLVAGPTRGFGQYVEVRAGEPFAFSSKYGTKLFALPLDAPLPAGPPHESLEGVPTAGPFADVAHVPLGNPVARIETTLRVTGVSGEGIQLERVGEVRYDAHGAPLTGAAPTALLVGLALLGALGLRVLARSTYGLGDDPRVARP